MKSGDAIWFKRFPNTDETIPANAEFIRSMAQLNGEQVCEIEFRGKTWIVRNAEISSGVAYAQVLKSKIEACTMLKQTKKDLAKNLGIPYWKLHKWERRADAPATKTP